VYVCASSSTQNVAHTPSHTRPDRHTHAHVCTHSTARHKRPVDTRTTRCRYACTCTALLPTETLTREMVRHIPFSPTNCRVRLPAPHGRVCSRSDVSVAPADQQFRCLLSVAPRPSVRMRSNMSMDRTCWRPQIITTARRGCRMRRGCAWGACSRTSSRTRS